MSTITITLSDERLLRLKELAKEVKLTPEDLVRASLEEWLSQPKEDFARAADYVLRKNAELYRRLA
jgi:predicted transcriptional regulator